MPILVLLALLLAWPMLGAATVRIDLTAANTQPLPVALTPFVASDTEGSKLGEQIVEVITANLADSGLFKPINRQAFLQTPEAMAAQGPDFQQWRQLKAEALLVGTVTMTGESARVEFRVFDPFQEKQIVGRRYTASRQFWRHIAHRIADDIYAALTGETGYFTTRIAYIGQTRRAEGGWAKKLCVMDQDGGNNQCLTDGSHLVLTPRFSPTAQQIVYMSYATGQPRLYLLDLPTGEQEILGDFPGLNSSPRFSPDGRKIAMTLTHDEEGNPDIYVMDIRNRIPRRLTDSRAIDTSPSYSPDGRQIVFNSNRAGKPALYIMDNDGGNVRRLTYGDGRYYAPAWSPRGDLIAFVKEMRGRFHIGVIDPEGNEERILTDSFMDDSPSWSPNGRVILFGRDEGRQSWLYSIDLSGYNLKKIPTPAQATDPSWSGLLR